jgi:excisionase family DNA binding protein
MNEYVTVKELASILKLNRRSIYNLIFLKKIPYVKANGAVRFSVHDIENWLAPNRNKEVVCNAK